MVDRTIRESCSEIRRLGRSSDAVRLRRQIGSRTRWKVETFGSVCHLKDPRRAIAHLLNWLGMAVHRQHPRRVLAALRFLLTEPKR